MFYPVKGQAWKYPLNAARLAQWGRSSGREIGREVKYLYRHDADDWGDLDDEDKKENDLSVKEGFRLLSAYHLETGAKVWVIMEWDRSVTTILLPEDY
jgi:hypothetical protein